MNPQQKCKEIIGVLKNKEYCLYYVNSIIGEIIQTTKYIKINQKEQQEIDNALDFWYHVLVVLKREFNN